MKKYKVLVFVLILSLLLNIVLIVAPKIAVDTPAGTYESTGGTDGIIVAIESDGIYCIYRQGKSVIKEGKYKLDGNILVLDGDVENIMYYSEGNIVYNLSKGAFTVFERVDKTPTYIGID